MPSLEKIGSISLELRSNNARASFSCQVCHVIILGEYYGLAKLTSLRLVNAGGLVQFLSKTLKVIAIYMSEPRFHVEKWRHI